MQIINKIFCITTILFFTTSCVTFNSIHIKKPLMSSIICAELSFSKITKTSDGNTKISDLDELSKSKIIQVLNSFNINNKCEKNVYDFHIKIFRKSSNTYDFLLGVWSIATVLTAGLVPMYSSQDMEIYLEDKNGIISEKKYNYSAAVWTPFIYKQIKDDKFSFENFNLDSRQSIVGIEIAQLIISHIDSNKSIPINDQGH